MVRFKCPVCGIALASRAVSIAPEKMIECPNCHVSNPFRGFKLLIPKSDLTPRPKPAPAPVPKPAPKPAPAVKPEKDPGFFMDRKTGIRYPLPGIGMFSMGRKPRKDPPFPDIAIETADIGMSRRHVNVKVTRGSDGRFHVFVSNKENKNGTYVDGALLQGDYEPELQVDSVLKLNETELVYKKSPGGDETSVHAPGRKQS